MNDQINNTVKKHLVRFAKGVGMLIAIGIVILAYVAFALLILYGMGWLYCVVDPHCIAPEWWKNPLMGLPAMAILYVLGVWAEKNDA